MSLGRAHVAPELIAGVDDGLQGDDGLVGAVDGDQEVIVVIAGENVAGDAHSGQPRSAPHVVAAP